MSTDEQCTLQSKPIAPYQIFEQALNTLSSTRSYMSHPLTSGTLYRTHINNQELKSYKYFEFYKLDKVAAKECFRQNIALSEDYSMIISKESGSFGSCINPCKFYISTWTSQDYTSLWTSLLCSGKITHLYMTPNWEFSYGCVHELATWLFGKEILTLTDDTVDTFINSKLSNKHFLNLLRSAQTNRLTLYSDDKDYSGSSEVKHANNLYTIDQRYKCMYILDKIESAIDIMTNDGVSDQDLYFHKTFKTILDQLLFV